MTLLLSRLTPVAAESVALPRASGRVLAGAVASDRPSPPCDVSAMDGYAVRLADLPPGRLRVAGQTAIGHPPAALPPAATLKIFTGAAVPAEAEAVIRREDVHEEADAITFDKRLAVRPGQNIRRCGENAPAGAVVAEAGRSLTPAGVGALAAFGTAEVAVYRRPRVAILVTGDELLPVDAVPEPWQIRDSNGPVLRSLLGGIPWIELSSPRHVADQPALLNEALRTALARADAVILTGGVSMGDHDYVPDAVRCAGGDVVFHKVALRPGKPMLGAVGPQGQAILGLPGNPVSVMVTARRWAAAALRKRGGFAQPDPAPSAIEIINADARRVPLWWYRPVRRVGTSRAELVATMGSGDLVSAARSDGFIELPPDATGSGPWPYYSWSMT